MSASLDPGMAIRCALLVQGKRQADLSFDARISSTRISHILNGGPPAPREPEIEKLSQALDLPPEVLFPGDDPDAIRSSLAAILQIDRKHLSSA